MTSVYVVEEPMQVIVEDDGITVVSVAVQGPEGAGSDHGALSGLGDDDHTQYHNDTRGDARYYTKAQTDAAYQPLSAVLTATTASFTTADETKLDGIAAGATANDTDANLKNRANHTGTQAATTVTVAPTGNLSSTNAQAAFEELQGDINTINSSLGGLTDAVVLKGTWDASSGSFPGAGAAQAGWSYIVSVAGTVNSVSFAVNDRLLAIVDNASATTYASNWHKLDYTDQVLSVAGKTGAVTLEASDIASGTFADARIAQSNVTQHQAALTIAQSQVTNLTTDLGDKVTKNSNITGATKTKITYDAKGLVTNGADANLDDLGDVAITSPSSGQVIKYNGTNWVNDTISGGGGGAADAVTKDITQAGHGFIEKQILYHDGSSYQLAQADDAATADVVGMVTSVIDANNFTLLTEGYDSNHSGLTPGSAYFLSASVAGALTATAPSAVGEIRKPLFIADSTTSGYFHNMLGVEVGAPLPDTLDELSDVTITTPANGQFLKYNGSGWVNDTLPAGVSDLDDLSDVAITTPTTGQVIKYNGSTWVNDTVSTGASDFMVASGLRNLTNGVYKRAFVGDMSVGDNILYTCPSGKRAYINAIGVYNFNAASRNFYPTWRIGGTHYKFSGTLACSANASNQVATAVTIILEAGESIGINVTGSNVNGYARVVEYDNTSPVYAAKKVGSWVNGDNTLYTVPTGKSAIIIDNVGMVAQNVNCLNYYNSSGGSRNIYWNSVPSGGSPGNTNRVSGTSAVGNDTRASLVQSHTLDAGDYISINTNATTNTQLAWVMVMEI